MPSATSLSPMWCCFRALAMNNKRCLKRNVPALVIRFTRTYRVEERQVQVLVIEITPHEYRRK